MVAESRKRLLPFVLGALFVAAGGSAWAIAQDGDSAPPVVPKPTTGELAHGTTPSGGSYTLSGIDPMEFGDPYFAEHPAEWFCSQLGTSSGTGTQGCSPIPDAEGRFDGKLLTPSYSLLGTDRFFSVIAPKGVTAMAVTIRGETKPALSRSIDAGSAGRLLVVTVGGPTVTSRDRSSSRDYDVELLGPNGEALRELTMSDPPVD